MADLGYFHYHGGFGNLEAFEITRPQGENPMFVVQARKLAALPAKI